MSRWSWLAATMTRAPFAPMRCGAPERSADLLRDDHALCGVPVEIAKEREATGGERPYPHLALVASRDDLLDRRRVHLEFVGRVVLVGHDDEERLAARHMNLGWREAVVLQRDRIARQIL